MLPSQKHEQINSLITSELVNTKHNITLENTKDLVNFLCSPCINNQVPSVVLNIMHINIQSIRSNFDSLNIFLSEAEFKIDIIILTETWICDSEIDFYKLNNYNIFHCCREYNRSGGVIVYVKNIYDFVNPNLSMITSECVLLYSSVLNLSICAVYRSHAFSIAEFNHELENMLQDLIHRNIILIGDLNIDIQTDTKSTSDYINIMHEYGFKCTFSSITRLISNSCIDHIWHRDILSNSNDFYTARLIHSLTDHLPIFCKIDLNASKNDPQPTQELLRYLDKNSMVNFLSTYNFDMINAETDPNYKFNDFHNKITAIKNNFSFNKIKPLNRNTANKDWLNDEIIKMTKIKEKLYKKHVRYPGDNFYKLAYNTTARVLKRKIKDAKSMFLTAKFNYLKNSKAQWLFVNDILGIQNKKQTLPSAQNDLVLANSFNEYFVSSISCDDSDYLNYRSDISPRLNSFICQDITPEDIQRYIKKLNPRVSSGFDNINATVLKIVSNLHAHYIASLFNNLLNSGFFPDSLKISIVSPIYKKGDIEDLGNYRPISVLPLLSKVYESILKDRLFAYLNYINFFSPNQHGFLPNKSTETVLIKFTDFIYRSIDNNKITIAIFLDIRKAFDSVNHNILLHKLYTIGIRGPYHNLFKSYLSNRKQIVKIKNSFSDMLPINCGVFQGTVLGPLLFLIFINDLCNLNLNGQILTFADDTALLYSFDNHQNYNVLINNDLIKIRYWFLNNSLKLNIEKTKFLVFNLQNSIFRDLSLIYHLDTCNIDSNCQCNTLERVNSIKYLGVFIDSNLKWRTHISSVVKKLRFLLFRFRHLRYSTNNNFLLQLYYAWVHPIFCYGLAAWGGDYNSNISVLYPLQNKFIKVIVNSTNHPDLQMYKSLNILPLRYLYLYQICTFINRNPNFCDKKSFTSIRRINEIYKIPYPKKEIMRKTFSYLAPKFYNSLPLTIQNSPTNNNFKKQLKSFLFSLTNIEQFF